MKFNFFLFFLITIAASAHAQANADSLDAVKIITAAKPDVRWDLSTLVEGDFNDDGKKDCALVGYKGVGIILGVRASSERYGKRKTQYLQFGINPSMQAAICQAPAKLLVAKLVCNPIEDPLPGCKPSNTANSLDLIGGDCDPIHLYWNHKTDQMEWWRL